MGKNMTLIRHPNISTCFDDDKLDATFQNTQSIQLQKFCLFMLTVIDIRRYVCLYLWQTVAVRWGKVHVSIVSVCSSVSAMSGLQLTILAMGTVESRIL